MGYKIYWKVFCRVKSIAKAEATFQEISKLMNARIVLGQIEQYWKNTELYEVNFTLQLESNNRMEAVFDTLKFSEFHITT